MKLIVGLGNPGEKYRNTRHNTGFLYLDFLKDILTAEGFSADWQEKSKFKAAIAECRNQKGEKITLLKPLTYMNESGWSVSQYMQWSDLQAKNIILVHDDLDIPLGKFKFNTEKAPKIHYGILSIEQYLKTKEFNRLRIGVDNRQGNRKEEGISYVLGRYSSEEQIMLHDVFERTLPDVLHYLKLKWHAKG